MTMGVCLVFFFFLLCMCMAVHGRIGGGLSVLTACVSLYIRASTDLSVHLSSLSMRITVVTHKQSNCTTCPLRCPAARKHRGPCAIQGVQGRPPHAVRAEHRSVPTHPRACWGAAVACYGRCAHPQNPPCPVRGGMMGPCCACVARGNLQPTMRNDHDNTWHCGGASCASCVCMSHALHTHPVQVWLGARQRGAELCSHAAAQGGSV